MPSSPDPLLGIELQATGENLNTWGLLLNNRSLALLAEAIAGRAAYAVSGAYTVTSTNYVTNEARKGIQDVTSGTGGTVTFPSGKTWVKLFRNGSSGLLSVTVGGTAATIQAGRSAMLWSDGTTVRRLWDNDAGGARLTNLGTPTAATDAVTRGYVDDTAFNMAAGALPGQTGNAGKFLTTNGTTAGWGEVDVRAQAVAIALVL